VRKLAIILVAVLAIVLTASPALASDNVGGKTPRGAVTVDGIDGCRAVRGPWVVC